MIDGDGHGQDDDFCACNLEIRLIERKQARKLAPNYESSRLGSSDASAYKKVDLVKKWKHIRYCVATWTILTVTKSEKGKVQMMKSTDIILKYSKGKKTSQECETALTSQY